MSSAETLRRLPQYLSNYIVDQDYAKYSARDQAAWRYIMRQSAHYLKNHAHPAYVSGLAATGIPIDRIPNIDEMDEKLSAFGWGAVCVRGFIPPLAFLEFQSREVLPIAAGMRNLEHLTYTPAPDIVHEAAGHAPILADPSYRQYLIEYARVARSAIFSSEDVKLYEAIRALSDIKENPDCSEDDVQAAQVALDAAIASMTFVSEAAKIARMHWWTVEYGLVGNLDSPQIYGAGLLSSLGESRDVGQVQKIPFSADCMEQGYDITRPQPQLFVAKDFDELNSVLREIEKTFAFRTGGIEGLKKAEQAATVTTVVWNNGLSISGVLDSFDVQHGKASDLRWTGPIQIAKDSKELTQESASAHPKGILFSELAEAASREVQELIARASDIVSVHGGPADVDAFKDLNLGQPATSPERTSPYTEREKATFKAYEEIKALRDGQIPYTPEQCTAIRDSYRGYFEKDWLLALELLEQAMRNEDNENTQQLRDDLTYCGLPLSARELAQRGVAIANLLDSDLG